MHNFSDEEMDRLAREAAENHRLADAGRGWDQLSRRLDEELPQQKRDRRFIFWFILGIGLLAGGTGIYYSQRNGPHYPQKTTQVQTIQNPDEHGNSQTEQEPAGGSSSPSSLNESKSNIPSSGSETENIIHKKSGKISPSEGDSRAPGSAKSLSGASLVSRGKKVSDGSLSNHEKSNSKKGKEKGEFNPVSQPDSEADNSPGQPGSFSQPVTTVPPNKMEQVTSTPSAEQQIISGSDSTIGKEIVNQKADPLEIIDSVSTSEKKKKIPSPAITRKWEIEILAAPEKSNVKFTDKDKTGYDMGMMIGYRFNSRWSVQTGLLFSKKYYTTSGENYKFPPNNWTNNPNLYMESVKASCIMLDIPVNVRFNWLVGKKYSAFVSAGLSSYLMTEENFHYYYTYYNNPGYKKWTNDNSQNYFFSVGNLSAGFEQQISPAISIQAEPFFKFSLGGVGYGSVRLNSYGLFLGIKYKPAFKKK